ncbi:AraC family transcriptional regulator [Streptomyces sp. NPDC056486]|uniref:AraC family transcriptional regulator n=1 Tax=Streptomyces sp. NPDC056486 TaxID=3345835 RepID=UPI0036A377A8
MVQAPTFRSSFEQPVQVRTTDVDEARLVIQQNFYSNTVQLLQPSTAFAGRFSVARLGDITVGNLRFGTDVRMDFGELGAYHVDVPLTGTLAWHQGSQEPLLSTKTCAAVFQPSRNTVLDRLSGDCRVLAVKIKRTALETQLERLLDTPVPSPLQLAPVLDTSSGPGLSWLRLLRTLAEDAHTPEGLIHHELLSDLLHESLLNGLLLSADHRYRETLTQRIPHCRPALVKRAVDAMEAHPEQPFTVAALAEIANVSVRRLQEGFRHYVGMSPTAYLRQIRLARAHDELRWSDLGQVTVTDVAYRWGFTHLSRFSAAYRQRYGVAPSVTLRMT